MAVFYKTFVPSGFWKPESLEISVVTVFGKFQRILRPGLNMRIPFIEMIFSRVSIQNRSVELEFQATTMDQANVNFKAMLLFSVLDQAGRRSRM